jgi:hypothetical protein
MESVWKDLPVDLSEHICNQLTKVRGIDDEMKTEIIFWHLEKMLLYMSRWYGYYDGRDIVLDDLNMLNETDFIDVHDVWYAMDVDKRLEYYHSVMD